MNTIQYRLAFFFVALSIVLFTDVSLIYSQQITRVAPVGRTMRGISIADYDHSMVVGDSATIMINHDTIEVFSNIASRYHNFTLLPPPVSPNHTFYGISYYDSLHAIVVGDAGLILTTSDMGKSWAQPQSTVNVTLRAITHITGGIFQIVGDGGTILGSTNFGSTWSIIKSGTSLALYAEAFGSAKVGLIVGEAGTVLKSTDGGQSWNPQLQAGISHLNYYGVAMSGEDTAMAVGDSGITRFTNDGTLWNTRLDSSLTYPSANIAPSFARHTALRTVAYTGLSGIGTKTLSPTAAIAMGDGDVMYFLYYSIYTDSIKYNPKADTIWHLYDTLWYAGTARRLGDADGGIDQAQARYTCMAVCNTGPKLLIEFAGPYGEVASSEDSMGQWSYGNTPFHASFDNFFFASFDSLGFGYATVAGGVVMRTTDNGYTWKYVLIGKDVSGVYCLDSNTAFVAGWNGSLYRTSNGGMKWDSIPQITGNRLHDFAFTSRDSGICVGGGGEILKTTDGGVSWQEIQNPFPSFFYTVAFSDPMTGVAVGDQVSMIRTTDGGNTWIYNGTEPLVQPNSDARLRYIQAFPNGTYYVGSDSGILKSIDNGQTWEVIYNPPDSVGISFYNSKIGIVGLYSTSSKLVPDSMTLRYTSDGGKTWGKKFIVPLYNLHRLLIHWLNDCSFLLYGIEGFIMKVNSCGIDAVTEIISPASPPMKAYPNPSSQRNVTVEYQTEKDGPVTIELWDETGKRIATLYSGLEVKGSHERVLTLDANLQGTFFIRADEGGKVQTLRMIKL